MRGVRSMARLQALLLAIMLATAMLFGALCSAPRASANTIWADTSACSYSGAYCRVFIQSQGATQTASLDWSKVVSGYPAHTYQSATVGFGGNWYYLYVETWTRMINVAVNCPSGCDVLAVEPYY